jgi:hypothetical protein
MVAVSAQPCVSPVNGMKGHGPGRGRVTDGECAQQRNIVPAQLEAGSEIAHVPLGAAVAAVSPVRAHEQDAH